MLPNHWPFCVTPTGLDKGLLYLFTEAPTLACQVAEELTAKDVIRAHARDELGIDVDDMTNPYQAAASSALAFIVGAGLPLLAATFIEDPKMRILSVVSLPAILDGE